MVATHFSEILDSLPEPDLTALPARDPIEDLVEARAFGQTGKLPGKVLLQRLSPVIRPPLQLTVDVVREISYKNIRHAYIMLSLVPSIVPHRVTCGNRG